MQKAIRATVSACVLALAALGLGSYPALAQEEIVIGNSTSYSGPTSVYSNLAKTANALFNKVNDEGGIAGRKIRFISYDDNYSPPKAVEMARKLVEQDKVLFMYYSTGTALNAATQRYFNDREVPAIFMSTGSSKYGATPDRYPWTIGWQPTSYQEGMIFGQAIMKTNPDARIAVIYQNDELGKDGLTGLQEAMGDKYQQMVVATASYEASDPTVETQVVSLKGSGADSLIVFATPKFGAQAIRRSAELGWKPQLYLNSSTTSIANVLTPAGIENATGALSVQFLVDPADPQWQNHAEMSKAIEDYLAFMKKYNPDADPYDFLNVISYTQTQSLLAVLHACNGDFSRQNILDKATSLEDVWVPLLLPGVTLRTSKTDYFPLESGYLGEFDGKTWAVGGEVFTAR